MNSTRHAALFAVTFLLISAPTTSAAIFCVGDAAALATALNIADNNGQSDEVLLQSGTYAGNFIYSANAAESGDLTIRGGYDPACTASSGNPSDTVIDGGNSAQSIILSGRDNSALIVNALTITNGLGQATGAGADIDRWVNAEITGNIVSDNNTAAGQDGSAGMEIDRTVNVLVRGNVFDGNHGGKGGGLSVSDMADAQITHNRVIGNSAQFGGGGFDLSTSGDIMLANNLFAGNTSAEDGGGVDVNLEPLGAPSTLQATNNTFVGNSAAASADGGGIDLKMTSDAASASFHNNIFWNNTAGRGNDLSIDNDDDRNGIASPVALEFNDFNQAFFTGFWSRLTISISASNFNAVNPMFVNAALGDFHLSAASTLIDAGDGAADGVGTADLDGGPRVQGAAVDLGSFETAADSDGDGVADAQDNCTQVANADQRDTNGDGFGNACDADLDNDGTINTVDLGLFKVVFFSSDADADFDGDGIVNVVDLGVMKAMFFGPPGPSGVAL